jgi:hypothetical protein
VSTAKIARLLCVPRPFVDLCLERLERGGLVRLVPFFGGKERSLLSLHDMVGADQVSFTFFWREALIATLSASCPHCRFSWWKTGRVRQVDLLAEMGDLRIGFCFSRRRPARNRDRAPLVVARELGVIHQGYILHGGADACMAARGIPALPADEFMREPLEWIFERQSPAAMRSALERTGGGTPPPPW